MLKKKLLKKIVSLFLVIIMLINMIPNFSLLSKTMAATNNSGAKLVLKLEDYNENNQVFALNLYLRNSDFMALDITFSYPNDKMQIIKYEDYEKDGTISAATRITQMIKDNLAKTGAVLDGTSEVVNSNIHPIIAVTSAGGSGEIFDGTGTDTLLATMYLQITDENLSVYDVTTDMFNVVDGEYFCFINGNEDEIEDTSIYSVEGFTSLPKIKIELTKEDLTYTLPQERTYDEKPTTVSVTAPTGAGDVIVKYYDEKGTEVVNPTNAGTYTVKVNVSAGEDYKELKETELGTFTIGKAEYTLSGVTFVGKTEEYNGNEKSIEVIGELPEGIVVNYTNNRGTDIGEYNAIAEFVFDPTKDVLSKNYNLIKVSGTEGNTLTATLNISKAKYVLKGVQFIDKTEEYDGNEKTIEVTGAVPAGIKVSYTNNTRTVAGNQTALATFAFDPDNDVLSKGYDSITIEGTENNTLTATLTVDKANLTINDLDKTIPQNKEYNGEKSTATATIKEGIIGAGTVSVTYYDEKGTEVTNPTNVGTYTVKVSVSEGDNYNALTETEIGTFTISKAPYILKGVQFIDKTEEYDGNEKTIEVTGAVPAGIKVSYTNNARTVAGNQTALATFAFDPNNDVMSKNYALIKIEGTENNTLTATLTVDKANLTINDLDKTIPQNKEYNGEKSTATATIKEGIIGAGTVSVTYYDEKGTEVTNPTDVGTYTVKVSVSEGDNYNALTETEIGTFTISKKSYILSGVTFEDKTETYDGSEKEITVTGAVPAGIKVNYTNNKGTNAGEYEATATFVFDPENNAISKNYDTILNNTLTAKLTINKGSYTISGVTFEDKTETYDGSEKEIVVTGEVPAGIKVNYANNKGTDAGEYEATAIFTFTDTSELKNNYEAIKIEGQVGNTLIATLTIDKAPYTISGVTFEDKTETYDGNEKEIVVTGAVPAGIVVSYENNTRTNAGNQTATATFAFDPTNSAISKNYNSIVNNTLTATLTIDKANLTIDDLDKTIPQNKEYDGEELTATATIKSGIVGAGTVTLKYYDERGTEVTNTADVGTYTVKVSVSEGDNYNALTETEIGTFTINKSSYTLSGVTFVGKTETYDGNEKEIVVAGSIPVGIKVNYTNNKGTNVGEYNATAEFIFDPGNNVISKNYGSIIVEGTESNTLTATLKISKAQYILSGVIFANKTETYDGSEKEIVVTGEVPAGIVVNYTDNKGTNAGEYNATAEFTFDPTNDILSKDYDTITVLGTSSNTLTATLTIDKATEYTISGVTFVGKTETYDGNEKEIVVAGAIPAGIKVNYTNNKGTNAGEYEATAEFTFDPANDVISKNYETIANNTLTATLTIDKATEYTVSGVTFEDKTETYDGSEKEIVVAGAIPAGIKVNYTNNKGTNAGKYEATAEFTFDSENDVLSKNYGSIKIEGQEGNTLEATLTIDKATEYTVSGVTFEDKTETYDGSEKTILVSGEVPAGIVVNYTNNKGTDAGEYNATATFAFDSANNAISKNYETIVNNTLTATLTINKATEYTISGVTFEDVTETYDGIEKEITVGGTVPAGIVVNYTNNTRTDVGNQTATATFTFDSTNSAISKNYETIKVEGQESNTLTATLTINKAPYIISGVTYEDKTETYDGSEKEILVTGTVPAGIKVSYTNNKGTDAGEYNATATFTFDPTNTVLSDNYDAIKVDGQEGNTLTATLTIDKASEYTISGVTFVGKTETYDGNEKEIVVAGAIPAGIKVNYTNNKGTNAGEYEATAEFTFDPANDVISKNYETIVNSTLEATLTINKATEYTISGVTFENKTETYDGNEKEILVTGEVPAGIKVSYTNNKGTDAGEYNATAEFTFDSENDVLSKNYETIVNNTLTATLTIDKAPYTISGVTYDDKTETYDGNEKEIVVTGTVPAGIKVSYTNNKGTNAGEYEATATFAFDSANDAISKNYETIVNNTLTATLIINKATPTYTIPSGLEGYEGQTLAQVLPALAEGFVWTNASAILPQISTNGATYNTTVIYTPTDTNNYETVTNIPVTVTVKENEVLGIRIATQPETTIYYEGQLFDKKGMVVEANYAVGGWTEVSEYTIDKTGALTTENTEIIVTYEGKTAEQPITVNSDYITDIVIKSPEKTEYSYGDKLDLSGATITKVWASGIKHEGNTVSITKEMLSNDDITDFNNINSLGQKQITVNYEGITKTNAFQITVKDYISSIRIEDKSKLQTEYEYGDTINITDKDTGAKLYIIVEYAGGTPNERVELTSSMVSGFNMNTVKNGQTVTVKYEGKTDTYTINVKDKVTGIDITKEPAKKIYKLGETTQFTDIVIKNIMASGAEGTILTASEYTISAVDTSTTGEKTITVTKNGTDFKDTFKVKVIDATLDMYISNLPEQNYLYGEKLDLAGGTITVKTQTNPDGQTISMLDASVKVTGYNPNKLGEQTLTVTYTYKEETDNGIETKTLTDTCTVTVEDYCTGQIKLTPPTKLKYKYGEDLDLTGGKVAKIMASGAIEDEVTLTGEMISGYDRKQVGTQSVLVNYDGKTASFNVTVVDETIGISMNTLPEKIEYENGEAIDITGAIISVAKTSGITVIPVTNNMISGYNPNKAGTQIITVSYDGQTTQFVVNVKPAPEKPITPVIPVKPVTPTPKPPVTPIEKVEKYKVTFVDYNGQILKEEIVELGNSATAPELEKREGYKFVAWDREFDIVEQDITITAMYEEVTRAEINGNVTVEKGEQLDLSDVTLTIYDENGNKIDEIPVTMDMVSGFNPEKLGTQNLTITYIGEDGYEYTDSLKVIVKRPVETLGVKDETEDNDSSNSIVLPAVVGIGVIGLLLLLIAWLNKKNVEIYAVTKDNRNLVGKQKITKKNRKIELDEYKKQLENSNIEIVLNKKITEKLDKETIDVIFKDKKSTYKVKDEGNKKFVIKMKNI